MTAESDRPDFKSPVDLAREVDFSLGTSRVSPSTREVLRGADRELLEPRVMQVLVALFQANGRVVSRDELISRCWEGRIVGEDAINRSIGRLRRLSEVDREASFVIETIPRVGYRLVVSQPLAATEAGPAGRLPAVKPKNGDVTPFVNAPANGQLSQRRRLQRVAGLAFLAVAAIALAGWLLRPERRWTVESSRPFISTLALEDDPAFSPNGAMLAYTSGTDGGQRQIYVRNLAGGEGIRITNDSYDDSTPTWSSDGARLAYVAVMPGEPCRIMLVTVPAGEAREAGRCRAAEASSLAWQPDTPFVYSVERAGLKGDIIYRLDLDTGARQVIVKKTTLRDVISDLRCSPDGKWLAYMLRGQNIILRDLGNGHETVLGNASLRGEWDSTLGWAEDSKSVLASITGMAGGSEIVAYPLGGASPYKVYATAMKIGHLAAGGGLLALETDFSRSSLARASATPVEKPDIIDPANGLTWSPSFAPDGTLAFLSNRSGTNAIWLMKEGAAPAMLFDGGFLPLYQLRFSPDGTLLAVTSETPKNVTIKIMTRGGAGLSTFDYPSLGLGLPSWTLDSKAVILFDRRTLRTYRVPIDNPARRSPFAAAHWVGIAIRADGTFATRADTSGIWRIDQGIKRINSTYPRYYQPSLAFRGQDVLVPAYDGGGVPRILAQPVSGGPTRIIGYAPGAAGQNGHQSAFAVSPTSGEIIYDAFVMKDTNIDLLTLAKR
jgi:Tol biopolymer transport system component/DNA-binding winged helix-turn-helix (wHTH) protein